PQSLRKVKEGLDKLKEEFQSLTGCVLNPYGDYSMNIITPETTFQSLTGCVLNPYGDYSMNIITPETTFQSLTGESELIPSKQASGVLVLDKKKALRQNLRKL